MIAVSYDQWHAVFDKGKALMDKILALPEVAEPLSASLKDAEEIRNIQLTRPDATTSMSFREVHALETMPLIVRIICDHTAASRLPSSFAMPFEVALAHSDEAGHEDPSFIMIDGAFAYKFGTPEFQIVTRTMLPTQYQLSKYRYLLTLAEDTLTCHNEFFAVHH